MINIILKTIFIFFSFVSAAYAYLGPGIAGGVLVATLGIVIAIFAAIFGVIWFPLKRFLKRRKEKKIEEQKKFD